MRNMVQSSPNKKITSIFVECDFLAAEHADEQWGHKKHVNLIIPCWRHLMWSEACQPQAVVSEITNESKRTHASADFR